MSVKINIRKAHAWTYIESLINALYSEKGIEVAKTVKVITDSRSKSLQDMEFMNEVWSRIDIVEHINNSMRRSKYNLIGAFHTAEAAPDNWLIHHFHFVDASGEKIKTEKLSFNILKGSHIMKTDRLTLHRKLLELFKAVTGEEIMMKRLYALQKYILSNNDANFGSEL